MPRVARIFIGSSSEALNVAQSVRSLLKADAEITIWNERVFKQGRGFLESLTLSLGSFDFAILIATPDDLITTRGQSRLSPRDNILFELGLFMGHLGRDRTWLIHPSNAELALPSDLLGVVTASCAWPSADNGSSRVTLQQYMSALGPACDLIREELREWQLRSETEALDDPGVIRCYTNAAEAQLAIGKALSAAESSIFFLATNLSYTPTFNTAELRKKILDGVIIRLLILNPLIGAIASIARDFNIRVEQLQAENKLSLRALIDLQDYANSLRQQMPDAGTVEIRLYDTPPRGRGYVFDGLPGESFFAPYATRGPGQPLPIYHCINRGGAAGIYIQGMESMWASDDTISVDAFLRDHPDFF